MAAPSRSHPSLLSTLLTLVGLFLASEARALPDYTPAARQILKVAGQNDVVMYGEMHQLRDARRLLMQVLEVGFASHLIDAFATEYVLEEIEPDFQAFLTDREATPGSAGESRFFARLDSTGFVWLRDDLNKDYFRFLRVQKQIRPDLKICGLDVSDTSDQAVRQRRFETMPRQLLAAAKRMFRLDLANMVNSSTNYDREPLMALRTVRCIADARRSLVHIGSYHAWSLGYDPTKYESAAESRGPGWATVSTFLHELKPNAKIVTMVTAQPIRKPGTPIDDIGAAFVRVNASVRGTNKVFVLPTANAPPSIKALLWTKPADEPAQPLWRIWDYLILGPEGDYAPIFD